MVLLLVAGCWLLLLLYTYLEIGQCVCVLNLFFCAVSFFWFADHFFFSRCSSAVQCSVSFALFFINSFFFCDWFIYIIFCFFVFLLFVLRTNSFIHFKYANIYYNFDEIQQILRVLHTSNNLNNRI